MTKNIDTTATRIESTRTGTFDIIDSVELDNVTGGCGACGCSSPATATSSGAQNGAGFLFGGRQRR